MTEAEQGTELRCPKPVLSPLDFLRFFYPLYSSHYPKHLNCKNTGEKAVVIYGVFHFSFWWQQFTKESLHTPATSQKQETQQKRLHSLWR